MAEKIKHYKKLYVMLSKQLGREPLDEELIEITGFNQKTLDKIKHASMQETVSLETPVADDLMLLDYIIDESSKTPESLLEQKSKEKDVKCLLENLEDREKYIISNRFGIDCDKPRTLEAIGKDLGFSKERIRQIEKGSLKKLRIKSADQELKHYIG